MCIPGYLFSCTPLCPWALTSWEKADVRGRNGWIVGWFQGSIEGVWQQGRVLKQDSMDQQTRREQWKCFPGAAPLLPYHVPDWQGKREGDNHITFLLFVYLYIYTHINAHIYMYMWVRVLEVSLCVLSPQKKVLSFISKTQILWAKALEYPLTGKLPKGCY